MADYALRVVSPIINKLVTSVVTLVKDEFLLGWNANDDVQKLSSNLSAIQETINDAEERQLDNPQIKDWLRKLEDVADDAQDELDLFATEIFLWKKKHEQRKLPTPASASKFFIQSKVAHKIKGISAKLDIIAQERHNFHLIVNGGTSIGDGCERPPTDEFVNLRNVFGRHDDKEIIIQFLLSDNNDEEEIFSVLPIIGMGGLGKTTLAQLVYNDERVIESFDLSRIWVSVSKEFNLTRILRGIMESYSKMDIPTDLSPNIVSFRFKEFLPGKRFLLVLDDVWNENYNDWEPLLHLLKLGLPGSKVLVTSRSQEVAKIVGTRPPHSLGCLPENECWSLFERIAFKEVPDHEKKNLEDIGREIVAKCNGLPLAVKSMGGLLCGNVVKEKWRLILRSNIWELHDNNILPALKLSYNHLPSYLKQCFVFCSIFPKAYAFNKEELVKLWMAQSFVQPRGENSIEVIGADYFDMLLMRSFFQPLNVNNRVSYRMHDLIHDLAQSISGQQYCQVKDSRSFVEAGCQNWRHVSLLCQDVEEHFMKIANNCRKLHTLLLPREHLKNFGLGLDKLCRSLAYIRTLDLSSSSIRELPSSIEECKLLRFLDLSNTEIKELPNSICNLINLQTLKLFRCRWLFALPKDLGNLVNLRHLEMDSMFWFKCTTVPSNIGNLKGLHNLHAFKVSHQTGYQIRELGEMAYLTGTLRISNLESAMNAAEAKLSEKERLQKVVFEWTMKEDQSQDETTEERVLNDLQPHSDIKELVISCYMGARVPSWMTDGRLRNLVTISLDHCKRCKILSFDQLPSLSALYIKDMPDLDILQCTSLSSLKISCCPKLSVLSEFMPHLTVLKIKHCASLKALPVSPSLMFMILVDNVLLEDWREATMQITYTNDHTRELRPSFIKLLEMKVVKCPMLQALPQVFCPQKLEISGCPLLTALPTPEFSRRLQHLAVDESSTTTLLRAIPTSSSLYSLTISNISNAVSLPKLPHLPGLKALHIHNCEDLESLFEEEESFRSLASLKLLSILGCQKLVSLPDQGLPTSLECLSLNSCKTLRSFGDKEALKRLTSLKDLYVEDCPMLDSFPEDGLPASLQHLCMRKCPELAEKCQKEVGSEWAKIADIPDLEIDVIEPSSMPLVSTHRKKPWYHHLFCGKGINMEEFGESSILPENRN